MKKIKKHLKLFLKLGGVLLILTGIVISLYWHLKLKPMCQRHDPVWQNQFTIGGQWTFAQKNIRNNGWTHDDFYIVGRCGGERWAKWIMDQATTGASLYGCGRDGHKASALRYITNQDASNNDNQEWWLEWWKINHHKSQLDWIQDGFSKYNVTVTKAPKKKEQEDLLILIGDSSKEEENIIPHFVKYNAFRWLRDSGFNSIDFALAYDKKPRSIEVIKGLREYQKFNIDFHKSKNVGILPLLEKSECWDYYDEPRPAFFSPEVQIMGYCLMIVPIVVGVFLLLWSIRKKEKSNEECTSNSDSAAAKPE